MIKKVLDYLSNKEWNLAEHTEETIKKLREESKNSTDINLKRTIKNYTKFFKRPLYFKHELGVYKTGRIFAQYVLFPNKKINGIYLKELIIPKENYTFVSFDYKTSQIRHIAVFRGLDEVKSIVEKEDIYERFSKESQINNRSIAKTSMLILSYGGSRETLIEKYPETNKELIDNMIRIYEKWFKTENMKYEEKSQLANTIQNIEAKFFRRKLITLYKKQNEQWNLHAFIHDEIIIEMHKDHLEQIEKIKKYLEKNDEIKMEVEVKTSNTFQFERK